MILYILLAEIKPEDVILFPVIDEKEPDDPVILFPLTTGAEICEEAEIFDPVIDEKNELTPEI